MSDLVPYLPNSPMVVEDYAANGRPDQRYVAFSSAPARSGNIWNRGSTFNSKRVGVMPLGDQPPPGTGKEMWDGVCLVPVVSNKQ